MQKPLRAISVQKIGNELAIAWDDGRESFIPLEGLRRHCPCAVCGGEPDVLGNLQRPEQTYTDRSFELVGLEYVGGYAIQPRWGDGHSTGIYSWNYLNWLAKACTD